LRAAVRVTRPRGRVRCRVRAGLPLPSPTGPPSTAQLASQPHDRYVESYQGSIVEITVVHPHTNPALPCWGRARSSHARAAVERPRGRPASPQHVRIAKHCRHGTRPPRNTAPASMQRHASLAAAPLARCCPHQHGMHVCTARAAPSLAQRRHAHHHTNPRLWCDERAATSPPATCPLHALHVTPVAAAVVSLSRLSAAVAPSAPTRHHKRTHRWWRGSWRASDLLPQTPPSGAARASAPSDRGGDLRTAVGESVPWSVLAGAGRLRLCLLDESRGGCLELARVPAAAGAVLDLPLRRG